MLVPLSWIGDFTPLEIPATDEAAVRDLSRVLDSLGLVTEHIEKVHAGPGGVVLARVLAIAPIEGADRIRLVTADRGDGEPLEIVCGATNFAVGDVVPLAQVGTTLPNGMTIELRTMRGVTSNGMLCSGRELGLSEDSAGLMILASTGAADAPLPAGVELGMALTDFLGLEDDVVFDLAIEPNRPDCLCIAGIARDLAARLHLPFAIPTPHLEPSGTPAVELASIAVLSPELCRGLYARVITGLSPMASPRLVQRRLVLSGVRAISAVVDATNYVMLELGQPTHAYDLDRLGGSGLTVRLATEGEELTTLDKTKRTLAGLRPGVESSSADGLICDANGSPVGLAGVMGGLDSETTDETSRVLLEVADFDPVHIGRAAQRHNLRSEASARFWRGIDTAGQERAADRVLELIVASAQAAGLPAPVVAPGTLADRPVPVEHRRIHLRTARANALLGTDFEPAEIQALLSPIGFHAHEEGLGLEVIVPTYRPDARLEVDVIEEIARQFGYGAIAGTPRSSPRAGTLTPSQIARRTVRRTLAGLSFDEAWTSSLVDPEIERRAGETRTPIVVENPIVAWESTLRTHLLPGLLGALRHNVAHRNGEIRLFETGHVFASGVPPVFAPVDPPVFTPGGPPDEHDHLGALLAGPDDGALAAAGVLDALVEALRIDPSWIEVDQHQIADDARFLLGAHPTRSGIIRTGSGEAIGAVGEVDPAVLVAFELPERPVGWLVVDLDAFLCLPRRSILSSPVTHYPTSDLDLAFVLPESIPAARLAEVLRVTAGESCESIRLIDAYRAAALEVGTRSLTYRLRLRSLEHTLDETELAELRARLISAVESALPARLRA